MGTYEIRIHINDESELYNSFDESKSTLNESLLSYLQERYTEKEFGKRAVLVFSGAKIDEDRLRAALRRHVETELDLIKRKKKFNFLKQLRLFLIGLVFVAAGIILGGYLNSIPLEILSIIGSFAVWEAADIWIVENPTVRLQKRLNEKLLEAEIIIKS